MIRRVLRRLASSLAARRPVPRTSPDGTVRPSNTGWCACCRRETEFIEVGEWLRDQYLCRRCRSIPRFRAINLTLDAWFAGWEGMAIHESSPATRHIRRYASNYSSSFFFEDVPCGQMHRGSRCENLERLTYADEIFDLFVTQDVLEHVFQPDLAVREIMRVVRPGGAHVFTTPKHKGLHETRQRARLDDGRIVHLLEAQYHGNPIGDGRSLVTWDYGDDFEACLQRWCGHPTETYVTRDRRLGLDGEYLEVFVTRKTAPPDSATG